MREHLPGLFQAIRKKIPGLKISLREGFPAQLETMLLHEEIDLAITLIEKKTTPGIQSPVLVELPLVLLVPKNSATKSAEGLCWRDKIDEPLICRPAGEPMTKYFQQRLTKLGVDWFPSIEAGSLDLVEAYVANGLGIGVSTAIPKKPLPAELRALLMKDFPKVRMGVLWCGRKTPLVEAFLAELKSRAERLR